MTKPSHRRRPSLLVLWDPAGRAVFRRCGQGVGLEFLDLPLPRGLYPARLRRNSGAFSNIFSLP